MYILVTNDDGIDSAGISALVSAMRRIGDVVVIAPDRQQSAVGHALTVASPLRATPFHRDGEVFGWAINGTPADCVKLGVSTLLDRRPDMVVSGINHGSNTSVNAIYSGTVSAATEGTLMGIPSMAVSLATFDHSADMSLAADVAYEVASRLLQLELPPGTLLNVNVPAVSRDEFKGIRLTRQGHNEWNDGYDVRVDPQGRPYYWLMGEFVTVRELPDGDDHVVKNGYAAITPIHYELTNFGVLETLRRQSVLSEICSGDQYEGNA
ncbi:MAG: 5'/3'-nucleotidase SurE [Candidatus Kapabacteria bacterium]|nr:5'/3'-nucleotidase SurE [Candidatus Kapabacteria bacterium]